MVWWWVANIAGLLVVVPLVVVLANRVIMQAKEIGRYADEILDHGVRLTGTLDPLPALADTKDLVEQLQDNAVRYVTALDRVV